MNADYLLKHFHRLSEAPDAIQNLRRFILDLAVRGKLVEQDPKDEPAAELIKKIEKEKARLVKERKIKSQEPLSQIEAEEIPFIAPAGWCWERLATISRRIHYGYTASSDKSIKDVRLLRITDIQDNSVDWLSVPGCVISKTETEQYKLEKSDILIARTGGTIGKTFLVRKIPVTAVFASYLIRVQGSLELYDQYLKLFLESPVYWKQLQEGSRGSGQPNVNGQTLGKMVVSLPPLAEQYRIVARVDELMALCDQLQGAKTERERTRDRLVASTLHGWNEPDASHDHARFTFNNLPSLTTRVEHIKQLRQSILNLAVRGKLVKQDPLDEPAGELLKRIEKEKARLVKAGEIKKDKPFQPIELDELPFSIPNNWSWVKLNELASYIQRGKSPEYATDDGFPVISQKCVQWDGLDLSVARLITKKSIQNYEDVRFLRDGDLLWNSTGTGTIGRIIKLVSPPKKLVCDSHVTVVRCLEVDSEYVRTWLRSNHVYGLIEGKASGSTNQVELTAQMALNQVVPLPPLAEQHRIVAKVDELMGLCDQLDAQIETTETDGRRLLEAVLHEALAGGEPFSKPESLSTKCA